MQPYRSSVDKVPANLAELLDFLRNTINLTTNHLMPHSDRGVFPVWKQVEAYCFCGYHSNRNCLDCYRWTSAVCMWTLATTTRVAFPADDELESQTLAIGDNMLRDSPYNVNIIDLVTSFFVDDMFWFCKAYISLYQIDPPKGEQFLSTAVDIFQFLVHRGCIPQIRSKHTCVATDVSGCNLVWQTSSCIDVHDCSSTPPGGATSGQGAAGNNVWGLISGVGLAVIFKDKPWPKSASSNPRRVVDYWLSTLIESNYLMDVSKTETYVAFCYIYALVYWADHVLVDDQCKAKYVATARAVWSTLKRKMGGQTLKDTTPSNTDSRSFKTVCMLLYVEMEPKSRNDIFGNDFCKAQLEGLFAGRNNKPMCALGGMPFTQEEAKYAFLNAWNPSSDAGTDAGGCLNPPPEMTVDCATQCGAIAVMTAMAQDLS